MRVLLLVRRNPAWVVMLAAFLSVLPLACILPAPPSDAELVTQFTRDSANYKRIMTMFSADTNIGMITSDFVWRVGQGSGNASAVEIGITEERLAEYRQVLGALRVNSLVRWAPDQIMFHIWDAGFGGNTHHRGIAWLREPASQIAWRRFRVIAAPWYIFED